jgi:hypothetical protein
MTETFGLTPEQQEQLTAQFNARLNSRADFRGSTKRRTGQNMANITGGVSLMPTTYRDPGGDTPMTDAMKQYVRSLATSDAGKQQYADAVQSAFAGAETDHTKSKYYGGGGPVAGHTRHLFGSGASSENRPDVRAWGQNIMSAYKKKYNIGNNSTQADRDAYAIKQGNVDDRRRHLLGLPGREET